MKNLLYLTIIIITSAFNVPTVHSSSDITGRWMDADNNLEVEIFKTGNEFRARVIWFDDSDDKSQPMNVRCDTKNADKKLRTRRIIGLEVMRGLTYNVNNNSWEGGRIYDSSSGKNWDANAWIMKDGILKVRGYWHFLFLGQNIFFKRV